MNDLMSLLPKYNPDPVFIFKPDGVCLFKNTPATHIFNNLKNLQEMNKEIDIEELIKESRQKSITHKIANRYYRINLVGVAEKNVIMAYSQDITELIISMQKEQEAMQVKDDFFRNISHEMKTPLNAITGLFPLIKKAIKDSPKLTSLFDLVTQSTQQLQELIDKVLEVQYIQTKQIEIKKQSFALLPELILLFSHYRVVSQEKKQDFRVFIDKSHFVKNLFGDKQKILKIIKSLLDNAIKFTPEGGIVATKVHYDIKSELLSITIKDNGIGISDENQEKIFQAQQVDASLTRQHEGSGLELFIVSKTIQAIGGNISLKSKLHKGSEFTITIPMKQDLE